MPVKEIICYRTCQFQFQARESLSDHRFHDPFAMLGSEVPKLRRLPAIARMHYDARNIGDGAFCVLFEAQLVDDELKPLYTMILPANGGTGLKGS